MTYGDSAKQRHIEYRKAQRQELEARTDDKGLLLYANEYYTAYETLKENHPKNTVLTSPKFYLLCHALELALKSWLRKEGFTIDQLANKMGHNLIALVTELVDNYGLIMPPDALQAIELANQYYDTKQYEYYVSGSKFLPDPDYLSSYVRLLLGATKSHVVGIESIRSDTK